MAADGASNQFIKDVIDFIDKPLSPGSLSTLRRSAKQHRATSQEPEGVLAGVPVPAVPQFRGVPATEDPAMASREGSPLAAVFPLGAKIETQHLTNNIEFNGLRGIVVGHRVDKVLIEFDGGAGQIFDIPSFNLRVVNPADLLPPSALPAATATVAANIPVSVPLPDPAPTLTERQSKLRVAMSYVEASKDALKHATDLYQASPEALIDVVLEFQPTLTRETVDKNWVKIVQIYQDQAAASANPSPVAEATSAAATAMAVPPPASLPLPPPLPAPIPAVPLPAAGAEVDGAGAIQGVLDFIEKPLSPSTLKEVRTLRKSLSPKRDR